MESKLGSSERARELFRRASDLKVEGGERGNLLCHWAEEEKKAGDVARARELLDEARGLASSSGGKPNKSLHVPPPPSHSRTRAIR